MKTWIIVGTVVIGLIVFVFGKETVSYLSGARQYTKDVVKERIPTDIEIARLKNMLQRLDRVIEKRRGAMVDMQMQSESLEKEIKNRRKRLKEDDALLRKVARMLEKRQDSYDIGGIKYAYAEVDTDAQIKAERFRQDRELLVARGQTLIQLTVGINDARKVLSDAEVERQKLANAVEHLGIKAERLKTATNLETGKQYCRDQSLGKAYANIQQAISDLSRRLEKGERVFDMKKVSSAGIDYAKNSRKKSGLEALREALQ